MTIFSESGASGSRLPLVNADLVEQLVSIHSVTSDLRWAMVELAWRSFTAMFAFAQGHRWARRHHTSRQARGSGRPCCC
jgi:hypothetical protein